jgi:hypothetical protein
MHGAKRGRHNHYLIKRATDTITRHHGPPEIRIQAWALQDIAFCMSPADTTARDPPELFLPNHITAALCLRQR